MSSGRKKGWNPDCWFGHTEKAMLLLACKEYARKAKHGYVRGREPVNYVSNIRLRFRAYTEMSGTAGLYRHGESLAALPDTWLLHVADLVPDQAAAGMK